MNNILVTGGAGFIGSNFIEYYLSHSSDNIVNLDALTYAGNLENLSNIENHSNYTFIHGDITNKSLVREVFLDYKINNVIHFAAESHVDNSIHTPDEFIKTNINGSFVLLQQAYNSWMQKPFNSYLEYQESRFLHISTDEVYGSLGNEGLFTESTPYAPNSPYSASKASSDMLVRSYHHTYGLNTVITNCSNNYGPKQHSEKLIPTVIRNAIQHKNIPIYGTGKNIRDWLYVKDHCEAINSVFHRGQSGETYNIGNNNEQTNIDIARKICEILDQIHPSNILNSYKELITFVKDRAGHDWRYAIDSSKIESQLMWKARADWNQSLKETVEWFLENT